MKKYVKPVLIYEEFKLSEHIADCAWEMQAGNSSDCVASPDDKFLIIDDVLFASDAIGCSAIFDEYNYGDYCYQNSLEGANIFNS